MPEKLVKLGYNYRHKKQPIFTDTGHLHMCLVGGTGSGKSVTTLYILYNILKLKEKVELYICDFKKSGDYAGLTKKFAEFDKVTNLIDEFYDLFEATEEGSAIIRLLVIDEYAGYISYLEQENGKKECERVKSRISRLLMLSRSKHMFVWCIQQRMSAGLFPSAAGCIDNFMCVLGMGRLTVDGRRSLFAGMHFDDLEFEEHYQPSTGQGICLVDGQPLYPIEIPRIDKEELKRLLRKLAAEKSL